MIQSSKPRKQRYFRFNAPMHIRQNFVNVHISKELSAKLGIKKRSIEVRKGDTVKIMSGDNKGKLGKVTEVNLSNGKVSIEGVSNKNAKAKEKNIPIYASNLYLIDIDLADKIRNDDIGAIKAKK
jgi:large subunit ribosomal protein L24